MATKTITDLQLRDDFDATCNIPVEDGVQTYRATGQQVLDFILDRVAVEYIADFVYASATQISLPASKIRINNILYENNTSTVFDFANGTGDNGLDTGSETTNTWYFLYAIPDTPNFILKASTATPVEYGGAGPSGEAEFRYLGCFRNGDNNTATGDILRFVKAGPKMGFLNRSSSSSIDFMGIKLATAAAATSVNYTVAVGTGATDLPFDNTFYTVQGGDDSTSGFSRLLSKDASTNRLQVFGYMTGLSGSQFSNLTHDFHIHAAHSASLHCEGSSANRALYLAGLVDPVLARQGHLDLP
jgi:hypothetical protein